MYVVLYYFVFVTYFNKFIQFYYRLSISIVRVVKDTISKIKEKTQLDVMLGIMCWSLSKLISFTLSILLRKTINIIFALIYTFISILVDGPFFLL